MQVQGIDERRLVGERNGGHFVVFIYTDGGASQTTGAETSWAVDSLLITRRRRAGGLALALGELADGQLLVTWSRA